MNHKKDSTQTKIEESLALYKKDQEEFKNHRIWKELGCAPEKFFEAVKAHISTLNIPKEKWDEAYKKTKDINRVRALEKRTMFSPMNLRMISNVRV